MDTNRKNIYHGEKNILIIHLNNFYFIYQHFNSRYILFWKEISQRKVNQEH